MLVAFAGLLAVTGSHSDAYAQNWPDRRNDRHRDHDNAGTAIAAGIVGLAIGAAIADNGDNRHRDVYSSPPPSPSGTIYGDRPTPYYAPPYQLSFGITCYPSQRACYHTDGMFAALTTHEEFGD